MRDTILDMVKKEVSAIWADRITWRGNRVTLVSNRRFQKPSDVAAVWQEKLDEVRAPYVLSKFRFQVIQFGCSEAKDGGSTVTATFELKVG